MSAEDSRSRRDARLAAYEKLQAARPHLFANPPGAAFEILFDRADQDFVSEQGAAWARANGLPEEYGDIGVVYQDAYTMMVRDAVRFRTGDRGAYFRVCPAADGVAAAVLPVLDDGRVVLLRHFRHADRRWHWEIPRGFAEGEADGEETARREVGEELGCEVRDLVRLGTMVSDSGMTPGGGDVYLGLIDHREFEAVGDGPGKDEGIDAKKVVGADDLRSMIAAGEIDDSFTLTAYALAVAQGRLPGR
ncbi:NUDIX hydrolase [Planomonospora sphaerica]|uniref:NUDIX hydrolase n=1 Tax=Planomonospora sphaerica TaxID=161355 RepID=A0A171C4T3_9ACTN|nr:NUDIX hydrolase [Planomonospora sphaerica]GAT66110.1 NUDIX hydrolase [Planomonospora sphaerica]